MSVITMVQAPYPKSTHLIVDVRKSTHVTKFIDENAVQELFDLILVATNLHPLGDVTYFQFPEDQQRGYERGLTATQILTTSHMSYHSCIEDGGFAFDVFSCVDFDTDAAVETIRYWVGSDEARINFTILKR